MAAALLLLLPVLMPLVMMMAAKRFIETADSLASYAGAVDTSSLSEQEKTWPYEATLIKLAVSFEHLACGRCRRHLVGPAPFSCPGGLDPRSARAVLCTHAEPTA